MNFSRKTRSIMRQQRGAVFIVMLVFMIMGVAAFLVSSLNSSAVQIKRDAITADALAQAKEALIGYAVSVDLTTPARPGDLPCPDNHTPGSLFEGTPTTPCNSNALGRLPWKTLGLSDLRDSSGERLWYAVSNNFKNSTRNTCTVPGQPGCLNSDTPGTISIYASNGTLLNDGSCINYNGSCKLGAVAVIIAPGDILTRQGGTLQDRSSAGINTPSNYLDVATIGGNTEDNANFIDSSSTNGFIQGRVIDSNGNFIVNDQLLVITQDNIMQAIQKRVVAEVKLCLIEYAAAPQNRGRYPWTTDPTNATSYNDVSGNLFGRVPDETFGNTKFDSGNNMNDVWGPNCNIQYGTWWPNWKEMVFYGLSNAYEPANPPTLPAANACATPGNCVSINSTSNTAKLVVIVAGKMLSTPFDQTLRSINQGNASYYLEGGNQNANQGGSYTFIQSAPSATFNDAVTYQ